VIGKGDGQVMRMFEHSAPDGYTPTTDALPRRFADFGTLGQALDYAAAGSRGLNFHDPRGRLARAYPYSELREDALAAAYRLIAHGVGPGDRIAMVAETGPEFAALFFGAVYAGAWPVPLPLPTSFGGRDSYIDQLGVQMRSADPQLFFYPAELASIAGAAAKVAGVEGLIWEEFAERTVAPAALPAADPDDIAYLQYSSGSTRFPHGVAVTPPRAAQQPVRPQPRHGGGRHRPLRVLAALVS
jgi:fatty-acyl-CoA synthase